MVLIVIFLLLAFLKANPKDYKLDELTASTYYTDGNSNTQYRFNFRKSLPQEFFSFFCSAMNYLAMFARTRTVSRRRLISTRSRASALETFHWKKVGLMTMAFSFTVCFKNNLRSFIYFQLLQMNIWIQQVAKPRLALR
jgi:hypothetical protein